MRVHSVVNGSADILNCVKPSLAKFALLAVVAVAAAAVLAAPALLINRYEDSLGSEAQLVPWAWDVRGVLSYLPFVGPVVFGYWLFTAGRNVFDAVGSRTRTGLRIGLLVIGAVAAFAAVIASMMTSDDFVFPTAQPQASAPSPNGQRTAHLVFDCFMGCSLGVFIEEQGKWSMKKVAADWGKEQDVQLPAVQWIDDRRFTLVGGSPAFEAFTQRTFP